MGSVYWTVKSTNWNNETSYNCYQGDEINLSSSTSGSGVTGIRLYGIAKCDPSEIGLTYTGTGGDVGDGIGTVSGYITAKSGQYTFRMAEWGLRGDTFIVEGATFTLNILPKEYTVSFNSNGGSSSPASQTVSAGSSITLPSPGSRSGYSFDGWYNNSTYIGGTGASYTPTAHVTLVAMWSKIYTYTLRYNANGGTGAPSTQTYSTTDTVHYFDVSSTVPTRSGYRFLGWSTSSTATSADYQGGSDFRIIYSAPTQTLYAVWVDARYTYTLKFNMDGGTGGPSTQTVTSYSTEVSIMIPYDEPTKSGVIFYGWMLDEEGSSGEVLHGGDYVIFRADQLLTMTLRALYAEKVTLSVTFNANGGINAPPTATKDVLQSNYSGDVQIPSEIPEREGYTFQGWATSSGATSPSYYPGETITVYTATPSVTLYAVWTEKEYTFTIEYNANGGTGAPESETYKSREETDHTFTVSSVTPSYSGYGFLGWSLSPTATSPSYYAGNPIVCAPDSKIVLYAVWTRHTFTLIFNANGGTGAPERMEYEGTEDEHLFTIPEDSPEKANAYFTGWSRSTSALEPSYVAGDTIRVRANDIITLYAVWKGETSSFDIPTINVYYTLNEERQYSVYSKRDISNLLISGSGPVIYAAVNRSGHFHFSLTHDPENSLLNENLIWGDGSVGPMSWGHYVEVIYHDERVASGYISTIELSEHTLYIECADEMAVLDSIGVDASRNYYDTRTSTAFFSASSGGSDTEIIVDISSISDIEGVIEPPIKYRGRDIVDRTSGSDLVRLIADNLIGYSSINTVDWKFSTTEPFSAFTFNFKTTVFGLSSDAPLRAWVMDAGWNAVGYTVTTIPFNADELITISFTEMIPAGEYTLRLQAEDRNYTGGLSLVRNSSSTGSIRITDGETGVQTTIVGEPVGSIVIHPFEEVSNYEVDGAKLIIKTLSASGAVTANNKLGLIAPSNNRAQITYYSGTMSAFPIIENLMNKVGQVVESPIQYIEYPSVVLFRAGGMPILSYIQKLTDMENTEGRQMAFRGVNTDFDPHAGGILGRIGIRKTSEDGADLIVKYGSLNEDLIMLNFTPTLTMKNRPSRMLVRGTVANRGDITPTPAIVMAKNSGIAASRQLNTDGVRQTSSALTVYDLMQEAWGHVKRDGNEWGGTITVSGIHKLIFDEGYYAGSGKVLNITDPRYFINAKNFVVTDYTIDFGKMSTTANLSNERTEYSSVINTTEQIAFTTADTVVSNTDSTLYNVQFAFRDYTQWSVNIPIKSSGNSAVLTTRASQRSITSDSFNVFVLPDNKALLYMTFHIGDTDLSTQKYDGYYLTINEGDMVDLGYHSVDVYANQTIIINALVRY